VPSSRDVTQRFIERLRAGLTVETATERLAPKPGASPLPAIRLPRRPSAQSLGKIWRLLRAHRPGSEPVSEADEAALADQATLATAELYGRNIEQMIGTVKLPLGLAGPLRVNGLNAAGDYYVPLATTEAALVASYARGAHVLMQAGGATAALLSDGMIRSPGFAFASVVEAGLFAIWAVDEIEALRAVAEATTHHGKLIEISPQLEGDHLYLLCRYTTGDAAGQNMVTIATEALCRYAIDHAPVTPLYWFVEANYSGDKKASALGFLNGRGRAATASALIDRATVEGLLHTTPERMHDYWRMSAVGGVMSGTIGIQGHYANGLAALFIATGQDAACVAEAAVGVTRMELRGDALFASVTLPNLPIGTVGGGTGLPSQQAALKIMGLAGAGHAAAFAEVTAALCLAGELSIIGALAAGEFTRAHHSLARERGA
jgi:hydroxymethylglutaryl-CoA reductase (NADPH)